MARAGGLSRVGRGEEPGLKRWVNRIDDPLLARGELLAGTSGVDATAGDLRIRVGGLPLMRRGDHGALLQAVRANIEWPHAAATVTVSLTGDGVHDARTVPVAPGRNRVLLFAGDAERQRRVTVAVVENGAELVRASLVLEPPREWTVYLIQHSHLDIGYTDPQANVLRYHRAYLDQVIDLAVATSDWPDDSQFRWNVEANFALRDWMRSRPAATVDAFFDLARAGRIEVTALPFSLHTEACSMDELSHLLRFADMLRRTRGIQISSAMQTDVPGATVGLGQLLVDAGVRYLTVSHNYAGRSIPHHLGGQDLTRPFYWQTPAGQRLLTWFGDTPHGMAYMEGTMLGFTDGYDLTEELLPEYLAALAERPYPYAGAMSDWWRVPSGAVLTKQPYPFDILHLRVQGAYCDNAGPNGLPSAVVRQWNEQWAYPRLRIATNAEFFEAAEERLGDRIQTFAGDWTDWWADGLGSAATPVGLGRTAQAAIRSAQSLHAVADVQGADSGAGVDDEIDTVYDHLTLFDEHTWGAAEPWEETLEEWFSGPRQWHRKSGFSFDAVEGADLLVETGMERFASTVTSRSHDEAVILVFNPTMQTRTDLVRTFVPASRFAPGKGFQVVDVLTGEPVRAEVGVADPDRDRRRSRGRDLTFVAGDVPPFGYRAFALVDEYEVAEAATADQFTTVLRNDAFEVHYDLTEGYITSIVDRRRDVELVATEAAFGFGQYVHDRFTTAPHFNHLSSKIEARQLELLGERAAARHGTLLERSSSALWERLKVRYTAPGTNWLDVTITLPHGVDRVDLEFRLSKPVEDGKESGYVAFPFAFDGAGLRAGITGGVHHPEAPTVPGSCEHMRAIRHWLSLGDADTIVAWSTLEAPLVQIGNLHIPYAPFPKTLDDEPDGQTTVYSWLFNNIWDTNFPSSQGGEMVFHYSVATADPAGGDGPARALGASTSTPLVAGVRGALFPGVAAAGSFCSADGDVEVVALRRSRSGHDLAVVLQSGSEAAENVVLRFPTLQVRRAWVADHLDRELAPAEVVDGAVHAAVRPGTLSTVQLDCLAERS